MRASTAFFAGVGTVVVAIGAGVGGGLTIAHMMSPQEPKLVMGKAERRAAPEMPPSTKDPLVPVPYLAATQATTNAAVVVPPAERSSPQQAEASSSSPQASRPSETQASRPSETQASRSSETQASRPSGTTASSEQTSKPSDSSKPAAAPAKPSDAATSKSSAPSVQPAVTHEQSSAPDDANAKARDSDVKRNADLKRAERRKAERRQQWVDRRRIQQSRQELRDVEASVRDDSDVHVYREESEQPVRIGFPQIRLFGAE
jgi:hypothetical protein